MGMGKDNAVQGSRVESQITVVRVGLHTFTLVHAAIQEDRMAGIGGDQVLTTRHLACCA